ncbi:MAG TPA: SDR family NAD(P)-dependent oxidoreductase, partial [Bacteroidia bacterium]|nr:SDR family NAD(P)-dependent oxidoreductase [Bacteroidia bacterium]
MAYALITGGSKGIGKALAEKLAAKKYNILLVARSENLLKENAAELEKKFGVKTDFFVADISTQDSAKKIADWCNSKNYDVSLLINNAGYGLGGAFSALSLDEQLNMMQLNMQSLVQLTHLMLPILKKNKD